MKLADAVLGAEDCQRIGSTSARLANAVILKGRRSVVLCGNATGQVKQENSSSLVCDAFISTA